MSETLKTGFLVSQPKGKPLLTGSCNSCKIGEMDNALYHNHSLLIVTTLSSAPLVCLCF